MNETTNKYVTDFILKNKPKRVLEIGSGQSTVMLQQLTESYGGHVTSVETVWEWYEKVAEQVKGRSNITLLFDSDTWPFVNGLEGIFQLVIIDGPGHVSFNEDTLKWERFAQKYDMKLKKGLQSWFCLDRIWDHIDEKTTVVVDGRSAAVVYYTKAFGDSILIEGVGGCSLSSKRSFYLGDDRFPLYSCTLIRKKEKTMKCKLIAEIGWNHMGDMELAEQMVDAAARAGADYAKFQTWSEQRLKEGPWDLDGRRKIYKRAELTPEKHSHLASICDKYKVKFLTSCFSPDDLEMIRALTNEVKIASTEANNEPLVEKALEMFDHLYISTGATLESEYKRWAPLDKVTLLHCVSVYPCPPHLVNMPKMLSIAKLTPRFGYSGHCMGIWDAIAAISFGATVVEKHLTTDHSLPGRDNEFAVLPGEFKKIKEFATHFPNMNISLGSDFQECEKEAREQYARRWM